jgi:lipid-A-disaccharide synthase
MRPYVDHLMALLPFEPEAHRRLGGPVCTYVGHPLIERIGEIRNLDPAPLATRLRLDPAKPVLVVLPGSRRSEVGRLLDVFRQTAERLTGRANNAPEVIIPVVSSVREMIEESLPRWTIRPHLVSGEEDKWQAFRLAAAALAASGTVTLELAVAGTPMVIAYKVEPWTAPVLRRLIKIDQAGLPNLILGEKRFPEFIQENATPEGMAAALRPLLSETPDRERQLAALARVPDSLAIPGGSPSETAARIVLDIAAKRVR